MEWPYWNLLVFFFLLSKALEICPHFTQDFTCMITTVNNQELTNLVNKIKFWFWLFWDLCSSVGCMLSYRPTSRKLSPGRRCSSLFSCGPVSHAFLIAEHQTWLMWQTFHRNIDLSMLLKCRRNGSQALHALLGRNLSPHPPHSVLHPFNSAHPITSLIYGWFI